MDRNRLNQIVTALNNKNVTLPCPRCSSKKFSVVGESEISVRQLPTQSSLCSLGHQSTMPTIIVTCDNCGYISQHAQTALELITQNSLLAGLGSIK